MARHSFRHPVRGAGLAMLAFAVAGCATYVEGSTQNIAISTTPAQAAYCVVTRPGGHWIVTTPGVLRIDKSGDDLSILCSRPGYQDASARIRSELEGWTAGNLLLGGLPAGVDAATGAMYRYPDSFELHMVPARGAPVEPTVRYAPAPAPLPQVAPPAPVSHDPPLPGTLPQDF